MNRVIEKVLISRRVHERQALCRRKKLASGMFKALGSFMRQKTEDIVGEASKLVDSSMKFTWSMDFANWYRRRFCKHRRTGELV